MHTAPQMSKRHYEYLADLFGSVVPWPTHLHTVADHLEQTNPRFDREKFISRATKKWEESYEPDQLGDEIPY